MAYFLFWPARPNMEGVGSGRGTNIYACWRLRVRIPLCTCDFLLLAFGALGRKSQRARKGELCAAALAEVASLGVGRGSLIFPIFSMRVLRFMMLGDCWGQKQGFRPRCTGRAPEWPPKRDMPVLASQALATGLFPRFFQSRPARKLSLADSKCPSAPTQISPTRLKPPAVFVTFSLTRVFMRILDRQPVGLDLSLRLRANIGCETWLRSRVASRPKGTFLALKRAGTYGHRSVRAGALDAQIGAQNPHLVGSQAPRPL